MPQSPHHGSLQIREDLLFGLVEQSVAMETQTRTRFRSETLRRKFRVGDPVTWIEKQQQHTGIVRAIRPCHIAVEIPPKGLLSVGPSIEWVWHRLLQ